MSYNGWTNYETWCMALWIDNDEDSYCYSRELVRGAEDGAVSGLSREAIAAEVLKDWMEEQVPDLEASVWSDLLRAAFSEVDWYEIAENFLSE
jgi:hypothetical protein